MEGFPSFPCTRHFGGAGAASGDDLRPPTVRTPPYLII